MSRGDFWSRRKAGVEAEAEAEEQADVQAEAAQMQAALAEKPEAEVLEELGLPDPDGLVDGDDFKAFLQKNVPEYLRKRALRALWRSNPVLANVDGLNDYDEDYTKIGKIDGPLKTAYQVGKGMLAHVEEMARQAEAAEQAESDDQILPETAEPETADEVLTEAPPEEPAQVAAEVPEKVVVAQAETGADEQPPLRQRMRFHFLD